MGAAPCWLALGAPADFRPRPPHTGASSSRAFTGPARSPTWKNAGEEGADDHAAPSAPVRTGLLRHGKRAGAGPGVLDMPSPAAQALPSRPGLGLRLPTARARRRGLLGGRKSLGSPGRGRRATPASRLPAIPHRHPRLLPQGGGDPGALSLRAPIPRPGRGSGTLGPPQPPLPLPQRAPANLQAPPRRHKPDWPRPSRFYWLPGRPLNATWLSPRQQGPPPPGRRGSAQGRGRHFSTRPNRKRERRPSERAAGGDWPPCGSRVPPPRSPLAVLKSRGSGEDLGCSVLPFYREMS